MNKSQTVQKLLKYDKTLHDTKIDFTKRGYSDIVEANTLLQTNPNAFLFAVIFDQGIPAERAWSAPFYLRERLGSLDIDKLISLGSKDLIKICTKKPSLHRYNYLGNWIYLAAKKLKAEYEKDASNIWPEGSSASSVVNKLQEFKGIGQKKSNMAVLLLFRDFQIHFSKMNEIDIAYDIHVRRVLLRTGLAQKDDLEHMVKVIRKFHPDFPARLDGPLWHVGRNWCHANDPECEKCVLARVCEKNIEVKLK